MALLPLLAEKERETDAGRRGGRKGAVPMNEKDDGFMFGDDESEAPTWRELWDMNKRSIFGSIAGLVMGLAICLLLTALGVI